MKTLPILLAGICLSGSALCAPTAPSQKALAAALSRYLAERGDLCVGKYQWPIDVSEQEQDTGGRNAIQLPVLEKLGLVTASVEAPAVTRYALTEAGKKFYVPHPSAANTHDFCAGKLRLDKVVRWTPPVAAGAQTETTATYTYTIAAAEWARDPRAQQVFPMVGRIVNGQRSLQLSQRLRLAGKRWEAVPSAE